MKTYSVAVVGATGLVGQKMLQVLEERAFPVGELVPIASERSADAKVTFRGQEVAVCPLDFALFDKVDIALFSAGAAVSKQIAPEVARKGVVVIDNSSAWRMDPDVPLVVPEVNPQALSDHQGIIANPNCSTIQMVVVLHPLHQVFHIKRVVVATYQAVTGSGKKAVQQLEEEIRQGKASEPAYPHPIAYNCLPHIDVFLENGYTKEEMKMVQETHKIMGDPDISISPTTVRVPVFGGHSEVLHIQFRTEVVVDQVKEILSTAPGIVLQDNPQQNEYPMPITAQDRDEVFVGRIRGDLFDPFALNLWVVSDNLRKGAATNAVQIAEKLIEMNLL